MGWLGGGAALPLGETGFEGLRITVRGALDDMTGLTNNCPAIVDKMAVVAVGLAMLISLLGINMTCLLTDGLEELTILVRSNFFPSAVLTNLMFDTLVGVEAVRVFNWTVEDLEGLVAGLTGFNTRGWLGLLSTPVLASIGPLTNSGGRFPSPLIGMMIFFIVYGLNSI